MVPKNFAIAIVFLATFTLSESVRVRTAKLREDSDAVGGKALEHRSTSFADGANSADFDSAGLPVGTLQSSVALLQETFSQALNVPAGKQEGFVGSFPSSNFGKTLDYVKRATGWDRRVILMAACESSAFSCEDVIKLVNFSSGRLWENWGWDMSRRWLVYVMLFVEGRKNRGCISDPANAKSIIDAFEGRWRETAWPSGAAHFAAELGILKQVLVDNLSLKSAQNVAPSPPRLHTGRRTDEHMEKLVGDMQELLLTKASRFSRFAGYGLGMWILSQFESWLKKIRSEGEQFSGAQLVTLARGIPDDILDVGTGRAINILLHHLEQYVTGVTCEEVNLILQRVVNPSGEPYFFLALSSLRPNIVDGQNKVAIVAAANLLASYGYTDVVKTEKVLREVGVGLPPTNNPVFGLVEGNPVIIVVDESTTMDDNFTLSNDTLARRKFCHSQLESVLMALPSGTYFNVIRYSISAVKVFQTPVLVNQTSIDNAMQAVSWRGGYTPGQDPLEMLRHIKIFALNLKHQFERNTKKNVLQALRLAYGEAQLPSRQTEALQHFPLDHDALKGGKALPQIYLMTSGQPDGGARHILDTIDEFDSGRNIRVNAISWIMPADPEARQFAKELANKTGGFFRSIEQAV